MKVALHNNTFVAIIIITCLDLAAPERNFVQEFAQTFIRSLRKKLDQVSCKFMVLLIVYQVNKIKVYKKPHSLDLTKTFDLA